jgi:hypothetical protein
VVVEPARTARGQRPMDDVAESGQAGHQHHRRLADAQEDPLGC